MYCQKYNKALLVLALKVPTAPYMCLHPKWLSILGHTLTKILTINEAIVLIDTKGCFQRLMPGVE